MMLSKSIHIWGGSAEKGHKTVECLDRDCDCDGADDGFPGDGCQAFQQLS